MNTELPKSEFPDLHEKIQNGQLIIGLSSAIPGFIKKDPNHNAISFAPFYARDSWVNLPVAVIQEQIPASNGTVKEHLPLSFALKPGGNKEKVLLDIISALTHSTPSLRIAKGNGADKTFDKAAGSPECGMCARCKLGDEFCVDCYL